MIQTQKNSDPKKVNSWNQNVKNKENCTLIFCIMHPIKPYYYYHKHHVNSLKKKYNSLEREK